MPFPIDIKYIENTEKELGLIFPDCFKTKMRRENGGTVTTREDDWQLFPFFDEADKKRMSRTSNHIVLETKEARNWDNFPVNGIAIASNGSADFLLLLPTMENDKQLGASVFYWSHETGEVKQVAKSIEELHSHIFKSQPKKQIQKRKLNSLKTEDGFCINNIPSPWILTETIPNGKRPSYTFQIGKGTDCLVSLETGYHKEKNDNDTYWFEQWKKETGLKSDVNDFIIERNEGTNYANIMVRCKNKTPVFYWIRSNQTDNWYLKMKTSSSRHNGDFKELIKILSHIQANG